MSNLADGDVPDSGAAEREDTAQKKEVTRSKLAVKAEDLRIEAERLAAIAKKNVRAKKKLAVGAKAKETARVALAVIAKKKEHVRSKLAVNAKNLRLTAKRLAATAKENETIKRRLAVIAREKESVRSKLAVTAQKLSLKAKQLAATAKLNERIKDKLETIADEKETVRLKLAVTADDLRLKAKQLAVQAKKHEVIKEELAVTAEDLRVKAEQLAATAAEKEMIRAKDEAIISSIGDGLVVTDKAGKIVLVNGVFESMFGWKTADVLGMLFTDVVPMMDEKGAPVPESRRYIHQILEEEKPPGASNTTFKVIYVRKDKSRIAVAVTLSTILVEGKFDGAVAILRDNTKEMEVDKAKTEFVSLASHQLRTPLSAVSWYAEMLLAGDAGALNEKQKKYLQQVEDGNQRMIDLVNALLDVSRLELGTFAVDPQPTDVVKLAQASIDDLQFTIAQKKIAFQERHDEGIPPLFADPKLLGMIFQNLLSNAVKYTPPGGTVKLDIALLKEGATVDGRKVRAASVAVVVADTGYGIPKAQQDKIFTKLFRADNVRKMDTEGTGLGLYIVKAIVERSGGELWFASEVGSGTTFHVILPIVGMAKKPPAAAPR